MQPTPRAKRATKTLARIADITERRALVDVVKTQRVLQNQATQREDLEDAQRADEETLLGGEHTIPAGLLQLVGAARDTHSKQVDALDAAMAHTLTRLSQQRETHQASVQRKHTANRVAEHVMTARVRELLDREQKASDDLSCARFGRTDAFGAR